MTDKLYKTIPYALFCGWLLTAGFATAQDTAPPREGTLPGNEQISNEPIVEKLRGYQKILKDSLLVQQGRVLFQEHCVSCHLLDREIIGPPLASTPQRLSEEWLLAFIKNPSEVIASGNEYAVFLYEQYNEYIMPGFEEYLTDEEIISILEYIHQAGTRPYNQSGTNASYDLATTGVEAHSRGELPLSTRHVPAGARESETSMVVIMSLLVVVSVAGLGLLGYIFFRSLGGLDVKREPGTSD